MQYSTLLLLRTACCVYSYALILHNNTRYQVQPTTGIPKVVLLGYRKIPGKYRNSFSWNTGKYRKKYRNSVRPTVFLFLKTPTVLFSKSVSITAGTTYLVPGIRAPGTTAVYVFCVWRRHLLQPAPRTRTFSALGWDHLPSTAVAQFLWAKRCV